MLEQQTNPIDTLGTRERYRDQYWLTRDPISADRLLWRAQTFRHMVHLLPEQSILELGSGQGLVTRQLHRVSRGENPITAVTFSPDTARPGFLPESIEFLHPLLCLVPCEGDLMTLSSRWICWTSAIAHGFSSRCTNCSNREDRSFFMKAIHGIWC